MLILVKLPGPVTIIPRALHALLQAHHVGTHLCYCEVFRPTFRVDIDAKRTMLLSRKLALVQH